MNFSFFFINTFPRCYFSLTFAICQNICFPNFFLILFLKQLFFTLFFWKRYNFLYIPTTRTKKERHTDPRIWLLQLTSVPKEYWGKTNFLFKECPFRKSNGRWEKDLLSYWKDLFAVWLLSPRNAFGYHEEEEEDGGWRKHSFRISKYMYF